MKLSYENMGGTISKGKNEAVKKDHEESVLEDSSYFDSAKKESGSSNSISQKKTQHSDILPALSHSGSSNFKAVKNVTNNQGPYLDNGAYFKHKKTEKESGSSNSVLQKKNILSPLSHSGSLDFNSDDEDNETNNPESENIPSDLSSASSHYASSDFNPDDDENETKNNTFNEQFECDISKSGDNFDFERPDEIEENQVRSITYVTNIEDDHKDLKTLFSDAKEGRWEKVWDILPKKPYMINCCPEDRRYTLLHQAAFWNNKHAVIKLLSFPTIDSNGKIKENKFSLNNCNDGGRTALELVEDNMNYLTVTSTLRVFVCKIENQEVDTYHSSNEEPAIIRLTLAAYKNTFHPSTIERNKPLYDVLKEVFKSMNTTEMWETAKEQICKSVKYHKDDSKIIELIEPCKTRNDFFKVIIHLYTREDFALYAGVNMALRRQSLADFKPTSEDLALGPYILVLQTLLWFWDDLKCESKITFRKMLLSKNDLDKYRGNTSFTWLSFVSSSVNREKARSFPSRYPGKQKSTSFQSVIFIFNNENAGQRQPKDVQKFAHVAEEEERVYPAGSRFCVTSRKDGYNGDTEIHLRVISN